MKPRIKKLPNKLRVLTIPRQDTKAVTVLVLIKVGSRNEDAKVNGASHFIEHLLFKGTEKRPNTQVISQELDKIGAEYNAFTGKDHTGFYIKVRANKLDFALDMLEDMLFNSKFDKEEIERERGVILEEMNMYEDTPMIYCAEKLEEMMFGANNPLGRLTIGPRSVIKNVSRQQLVDYKDDYYKMNNMVIVVSGKLPKNTTYKIREAFHDKLPKGKIEAFQKFENTQTSKKVLLNYKKTEQVHLAMGFHGHGYSHKDHPAEVLLSVILGGNMSSRLFINVRERKGLAYFIRTDNATYEDTGALVVQSGLDKNRIYEAITAIIDELKKVKQGGVEKKELKRAQDYLAGRVALDLEDSSALAGWYGKQELLMKEMKTPEEKLREYKAVTPSDIKRVAKRIFQSKNLNLSIIGPYKDKKKFTKILSI